MPLPFIVSLNMPPSLPQSSSVLPPLSLYIHVPWCVRKCPYCDFNSHEFKGKDIKQNEGLYTQALIKQIENYPIYNLYSVLNDMIDKNILSWKNGNQICLNTTPDNPDDPLFGVGSLDLDWKNIYKVDGKTIVPPRAVPLREDEFTDLCSQFKGTVLGDLQLFTD